MDRDPLQTECVADAVYVRGEFWKRCVATLLDVVLISLTLIVGWVILTAVLRGRGQTPGKFLMRLVVVRQEDVEPASTTILVLRELGLKHVVGVLTMEISTIVGFGTYFTSSGPWWDIVWQTTVVRRATHEEIAYAAARTVAA